MKKRLIDTRVPMPYANNPKALQSRQYPILLSTREPRPRLYSGILISYIINWRTLLVYELRLAKASLIRFG